MNQTTIHVSNQWASYITNIIFQGAYKWKDKILTELIQEYYNITKQKTVGFNYLGKVVYLTAASPNFLRNLPHICSELEPKMKLFYDDYTVIASDEITIKNIIYTMINNIQPTISIQNLRDILPDCVTCLVNDFNQLPRTQSVAFCLPHDSRAKIEWERILPKIEYYTALHFIY